MQPTAPISTTPLRDPIDQLVNSILSHPTEPIVRPDIVDPRRSPPLAPLSPQTQLLPSIAVPATHAMPLALQYQTEAERLALIAATLKRQADEAAISAHLQALIEEEKARRILAMSNMRGPTLPIIEPSSAPREHAHAEFRGGLSRLTSKTFPSERERLELPGDCTSPSSASQILNTLGSTLRSKADKFVDVTTLPCPSPPPHQKRGRGAPTHFAESLYRMLIEVEEDGLTDVVAFLPHSRAFRVNNKERFVNEILQKYFKGQNKWSSFTRQCSLYGFSRATSGRDYGAYYHELFIKGRPELLRFMRRVGKPHGKDRRTFKLAEGDDPDFYSMPAVECQSRIVAEPRVS